VADVAEGRNDFLRRSFAFFRNLAKKGDDPIAESALEWLEYAGKTTAFRPLGRIVTCGDGFGADVF
jgi:hypothetical protein